MLSVCTARRTPTVHPRGPGAGPPTNSSGVRGGLAFSFYSSSSAHGRLTLDGGSVEVGRWPYRAEVCTEPWGGTGDMAGGVSKEAWGTPGSVRHLHPS